MEKTKQNKHRGNFTPSGARIGQISQRGRDVARKSDRGRGRKQKGENREREGEKNYKYRNNKRKCVIRKKKKLLLYAIPKIPGARSFSLSVYFGY